MPGGDFAAQRPAHPIGDERVGGVAGEGFEGGLLVEFVLEDPQDIESELLDDGLLPFSLFEVFQGFLVYPFFFVRAPHVRWKVFCRPVPTPSDRFLPDGVDG